MSAGDGVRDGSGATQAERGPGGPAPLLVADPDTASGTGLILFPRAAALSAVWAGPLPAAGLRPDDAAALLAAARPSEPSSMIFLAIRRAPTSRAGRKAACQSRDAVAVRSNSH